MTNYTRVSDKYYAVALRDFGGITNNPYYDFAEVRGVPFSIKHFPDIDLFVSRGWDRDTKKAKQLRGRGWRIYDALTGTFIMGRYDTYDTPQMAIEAFARKCVSRRVTVNSWRKAHELAIADTGLSPRYVGMEQ